MGIMRARRTQADSYNKWAVLFTVVVMSFMSTLDSSVVNVALPAMQRELGVSAGDIQWVSSVYLLVCCAAAIPFGRLGDRGGKVRYFQLGVALFTLGSLLCGLATTLPVLVAARVVQGVGASSALSNNMGIVTETFPAQERGLVPVLRDDLGALAAVGVGQDERALARPGSRAIAVRISPLREE